MTAGNTNARAAAKPDRSANNSDEPTKADIRDDLKIAFQQMRAGKSRPARVALAEIQRDIQQSY